MRQTRKSDFPSMLRELVRLDKRLAEKGLSMKKFNERARERSNYFDRMVKLHFNLYGEDGKVRT